MTTSTLSIFNLMHPGVLANPYPFYDELRQRGSVLWDEFFKGWICSTYREVTTALHDPRLGAHRVTSEEELATLGLAELAPLYFPLTNQLLFIDPPKHTQLRGLVSKAFTPRRVDRMREYLQILVDQMLADVYAEGRMEVIRQIASPLPITVIAELLGVPTQDREQLKKWSDDYASMLGSFQHIPDNPEEVLKSLNEMSEYFFSIIQTYRHHPKDTLLSDLVLAQEQGNHLDNTVYVENLSCMWAQAQNRPKWSSVHMHEENV
jgi:cytochrome P450